MGIVLAGAGAGRSGIAVGAAIGPRTLFTRRERATVLTT